MKTITAILSSIAAMALAAAAHATVITYTFTGTTTGSGVSVSAEATFTTLNGELDIDITNLLTEADGYSAGQQVSGITFTIAPTTPLTLTDQTGQLVNVDSTTGTLTNVSGDPTHWDVTGSTTLWTLTGAQPEQLILGTTGTGTIPNGSITNFNPYIYQTGHFVLTGGVFDYSTITAVTFLFGTTSDEGSGTGGCTSNCGDIPLPEPAPLALIAIGMLALVGTGMRRRSTK